MQRRVDRRRFPAIVRRRRRGCRDRRASPASWRRAARRPMPSGRRCTGCAGTISCPPPTSCCEQDRPQECQKALGIKLNIETINANDIQARVTSAVQSGTGPDIILALNNWPQLYAESVVDVSDIAEEIGKAQGGFYETCRKIVAHDGKKWLGVPWTIVGVLIAYRKSWFAEVGYAGQVPADLGRVPRRRQEAEGEGPSARPDARPHLRRRAGLLLSVSVVLGRQGGRGRRQDRGAEQQGDGRVGQVHGRVLEGALRRGRARLGRFQQQPRLPVGHDQRHPQRRLDLHRSQAQARLLQDRDGHADEGRHPARAAAEGPGGPVQLPRRRSPTC